ncbi:histidinol-phosphatase [Afifella sp. IM 167]|uniref:histidinol-phosphatase n=1 Tax=Afifella sp. IM 167 TaxID=2033586 RepID=UPI001CD016DB|nr:histidinol-phosphatase [Afifella sp. IM 167]MBZ8132719.1 histidinol-phosphatase [Afifella sp. IM 167]
MQSPENFLPFLARLAEASSEVILKHFRAPLDVDDKGSREGRGFDPVTEADRGAEAVMRELIRKTYPEHGIVGEEFGTEGEGRSHQWVLDPIDGTRAFICGLPLWGSLIGLMIDGKPVCGMLSQPYLGERFFGTANGAFFERGGERRPLRVRACGSLGEAMVSSTDPDLFVGEEAAAFRRLSGAARLTRYGYDCYAYAMVAAGFIDCVAESGLKAYDIVPLVPIIEGAGGAVISWDGSGPALGGRVLAIGDARLKGPAVELLQV